MHVRVAAGGEVAGGIERAASAEARAGTRGRLGICFSSSHQTPQYLTSKRTSRGPTACRSTTFEANASSFPRAIALIAFAEEVIAAGIGRGEDAGGPARDSVSAFPRNASSNLSKRSLA